MWTVAQLWPEPGAAALAIRNLERQGFDTFYPTFSERKLRRGRARAIEVPVFSGYIFVALNDLRWVPINSTYGINRLLVRKVPNTEYNEPSEIAEFVYSSTNAVLAQER